MPNWEEYYGTYDPDELNERFYEDCVNAARAEDEEYERLQRSLLNPNSTSANDVVDLSEKSDEQTSEEGLPF